MKNRLDWIQQHNLSIWSTTAQLVDDCELIIGQLREITRASQMDSSHIITESPQADGSTTAVASTPPAAGKKRSVSVVNELRLPELDSSKSLLQKYTIPGVDRKKRVHMTEQCEPFKRRTSTPLKPQGESLKIDPFCSPQFETAPRRRIPKAIRSDTDSI